MSRPRVDITNQPFGKLVAIEPAPDKGGRTFWKCLCRCGKKVTKPTERLRAGLVTSCGCAHKEYVSNKRVRGEQRRNEVQDMINNGMKQTEIAKKLGVSRQRVSQILKGIH